MRQSTLNEKGNASANCYASSRYNDFCLKSTVFIGSRAASFKRPLLSVDVSVSESVFPKL